MRPARTLAAAALLLPALTGVSGGSIDESLGVSFRVQAACTLSVSDLDFGNAPAGPVTGTAAITVNCSPGTPYVLTLGAGEGGGGARRMTSSEDDLGYELYQDPLMTRVWGDLEWGSTYPRGSGVGGAGTGSDQVVTVYGRIPPFSAPAGEYRDRVLVTLNF